MGDLLAIIGGILGIVQGEKQYVFRLAVILKIQNIIRRGLFFKNIVVANQKQY